MRHLLLRAALGAHLLLGASERERLRLRDEVGEQEDVVPADRVQAALEADQVARNEPRALVDELVEGVLAVRAGLAPDDRAGVVVDPLGRRA